VAEEDAVRLATPELPDTRSEAALPLRSRGQVIGALTVQSDRPNAFDEATIAVLQTMADQVAVALDNARLFAEVEEALEAERRAFGQISREAWREMLHRREAWGYRYANQTLVPLQEVKEGVQRREDVVRVSEEGTLSVSLKVRDQAVGTLRFRKEGEDVDWTADERSLIRVLVERLGVALESARLYEDIQRRAARERLTGEIATRMRETLEIKTVLNTAVREIGDALGLAALDVRLDVEDNA